MTVDEPSPCADEAATVSVRLYLDPEGRPIGSVRRSDGPEASFAGWLDLMAECSRLLRPDDQRPAPGSVVP